jgi:BlaI family penicillinase repressor
MVKPKGSLTSSQFEILELLWEHETGMSVAEIWDVLQKKRKVSRTTILNLVDRLEKRNWLFRKKVDGIFQYQPAVERESTEHMLADEFIGDFFGGSPGNFLLSLLGTRRISKSDVERLKKLLDESSGSSKGKKKKGK